MTERTYHEERRLIEHDVPDAKWDVNNNDIINAIRVVAVFNPAISELEAAFMEHLPSGIAARGTIYDAYRAGGGVFENLVLEAPRLADAVHNFVYNIVCPLSSITTRNITREQVARVVLSIKTV